MWEHKDQKYLTRKETADFLGLKVSTLNAWANKTHPKYIPFIILGKGSVYKLEDLEKFLEKEFLERKVVK